MIDKADNGCRMSGSEATGIHDDATNPFRKTTVHYEGTVESPSPPDDSLGLREGGRIGPYTLKKFIGAGGMSEVWQGVDSRNQRLVAIKFLSLDFGRMPGAKRALLSEYRKLLGIDHPNIVKGLDINLDGEQPYFVMEYLAGESLRDIIARNPQGLKADQATHLICDILAAIEYIHGGGKKRDITKTAFVHSDLKPSNIIIHKDTGTAKVIDFGISQHLDEDERENTVMRGGINAAEAFGALSEPYASVEMFLGLPPQPSDDVYAIGCIIYEILTGHHPFDKRASLRAQKEAKDGSLKLEKIKPLPGVQWRAIKKSLAFRRNKRSDSVLQLRSAFCKETGRSSPVPWFKRAQIPLFLMIFVLGAAIAGFYAFKKLKIPSEDQRFDLAVVNCDLHTLFGGEITAVEHSALISKKPETFNSVGSCLNASSPLDILDSINNGDLPVLAKLVATEEKYKDWMQSEMSEASLSARSWKDLSRFKDAVKSPVLKHPGGQWLQAIATEERARVAKARTQSANCLDYSNGSVRTLKACIEQALRPVVGAEDVVYSELERGLVTAMEERIGAFLRDPRVTEFSSIDSYVEYLSETNATGSNLETLLTDYVCLKNIHEIYRESKGISSFKDFTQNVSCLTESENVDLRESVEKKDSFQSLVTAIAETYIEKRYFQARHREMIDGAFQETGGISLPPSLKENLITAYRNKREEYLAYRQGVEKERELREQRKKEQQRKSKLETRKPADVEKEEQTSATRSSEVLAAAEREVKDDKTLEAAIEPEVDVRVVKPECNPFLEDSLNIELSGCN